MPELPTAAWRRALEAAERLDALDPAARDLAWQALLQSDADLARRVLALQAGSGSTTTPAAALGGLAPFEPVDLAGRVWGPYAFDRVLGRGGMGEVWLAHRSDGRFEGQVAIKLLGASTHPAMVERFRREGQLLGRLAHPRIARLLDAGALPDGRLCLVLELVEGQRIDHHCDAAQLPVEARIALFLQVCEAVVHAHANLVVHRDLKPSNILVDAQGQVKLLDFGIAKLLDDGDSAAESPLTQVGGRAMTPDFAAPEQVLGEPITTATDVYALGVLLYLLLSGCRPYGATAPAELMRAIVETDPPPLDATDLQDTAVQRGTTAERLRRRLRGDLGTIVAKALKKAPAERYRSVQALADDLQRVLDDEPIEARADSAGYRLRKFVRKHRWGVGAGAAVLLAVLAGSGVSVWQAQEARRQAALARAEADKANAIREFMVGVFRRNAVGIGDAATRQNTTARQLLEEASQQVLEDGKLPPAVRLEMLSTLGTLTQQIGLLDLQLRLQEAAVPLARQVSGDGSAEYMHAVVERGPGLFAAGRRDELRRVLGEAVAQMEREGRTSYVSYAEALRNLGLERTTAGDLDTARTLLTRALEAYARHHPRHNGRAGAARWLGMTEASASRFGAAEGHLRDALAFAREADSFTQVRLMEIHYALGDLYVRMGRYREAGDELARNHELAVAAIGPRHSNTGIGLLLQARMRHQLGDAEGARAMLAQAEDVARDDRSQNPGRLADRALVARSAMAVDDGDAAAALAASAQAEARHRPSGGALLAGVLVYRAEALLLQGRPDEAERAAAEAAKLFASGLPGTIAQRQALVVQAEALERLGRHAEAQAAYQVASALADPSLRTVPQVRWLLARVLSGQSRLALPGDPARASALAREAVALLAASPDVLHEKLVLAQARLAEAGALQASGNTAAARAAADGALALLTACQVPASPRLAQARQQRAALAGG